MLGDFNVFIGANASGKSNLLSVLTFVRDVVRDGLEDAVSLQGGIGSLRNVQLDRERQTCIEILACPSGQEKQHAASVETEGDPIPFVHYRLALEPAQTIAGFRVARESLKRGEGSKHLLNGDVDAFLDAAYAIFSKTRHGNTTTSVAALDPQSQQNPQGLLGPQTVSETEAFLNTSIHALSIFSEALSKGGREFFIPIFDVDVEPLKRTAQPLSGRNDLAEDGRNLALVLRNLLKDEMKQRKLLNLVSSLLPFSQGIRVQESRAESSIYVSLQESFAEDIRMPTALLSDGTLQALALVVALYFDERPIIAFEEPTRGLHPKIISQLVQMMQEVAAEKQLLVTTHNPELIKHAGLENVYLVSRSDEGFTHVTKPADKKTVQTFLEHDLGVDDLFVQNLL